MLRLFDWRSAFVWKCSPRDGSFVRRIHRSPVVSLKKGQKYGILWLYLWLAWSGSCPKSRRVDGVFRRALVWFTVTLEWRHNGLDSVSNHQPHHCLLSRLFGRRSKKTSKLRVTGLCAGNSPGPVNSPHKWPVTRKMFPFDDVIMVNWIYQTCSRTTRQLVCLTSPWQNLHIFMDT